MSWRGRCFDEAFFRTFFTPFFGFFKITFSHVGVGEVVFITTIFFGSRCNFDCVSIDQCQRVAESLSVGY